MTKYRDRLPQLSDQLFLTDGGLETTLIFLEGFNLPEFASFVLLDNALGYEALGRYFRTYAGLANRYQAGCVLESATWRASPDWAEKLGYSRPAIAQLNRKSIDLLYEVRDEYETEATPIVISGCVGPRADGYNPVDRMGTVEAEAYHAFQVGIFKQAGADLVTAITMNYPEEAIGVARAAKNSGIPVVVSFTVETDGALPTGKSLKHAIAQVDAATDGYPSYYMINCAHPLHFVHVLSTQESWLRRIGGIRPNASIRSHAELDEATELDAGNPVELGLQCQVLKERLPQLRVLGGCCGTDHRHVAEIFAAFQATPQTGRRSLDSYFDERSDLAS